MSDAAGSVKVVLTVDAASYSAALDKANAKIKQFGQSTEAAGRSTVSSAQASSAAIRTLEGGINGSVRAAEKFLSTIPGVGKALQAAFPVVGALALVDVFARIGGEVYKFIDTTNKVPKALQQGFDQMSLGARSATDALSLTNDKLENQIAKLEHKPENQIRVALDESRVAADKFAESVEKANRDVAALLKENSVGALGGLFTGQGSTKELTGTVNAYNQQLSDLANQRSIAADNGDTALAAKLAKQIRDKQDSLLQKMRDNLQGYQTLQGIKHHAGAGDQTANINIAHGVQASILNQRAMESSEDRNASDQSQLDKLQAAKEAAEAQKQVEALLLKQDEDAEKRQNAFNKLSINEEISFWTDRIKAFQQGGEAYLQVQNKIYELVASRPSLANVNKKNQAEAGKSAVEGNDLIAAGSRALASEAAAQVERATASTQKYNAAIAKSAEISAKNAQALQESSISIELQQGSITKLAAAQQLAAIHANEHAKALQDVNTALAEQIRLISSDTNLSGDDKANAIRNANATADNQRSQANGAYQVTQQQDSAAIFAQTVGGKWDTAVNQMVQEWGDMTGHLVSTFTQTANSLNDNLVTALTHKSGTRTHLWMNTRNTLSQGFGGVAKAGLEKSESSVLGAFGLGAAKKADGSASNPFHVIMAGISNAAGSAGSAVSSAASGGGGGVFGAVGGFLKSMGVPFLAGGGDAMAGQPHVIGEEGPELFVPNVSGKVVPNGKFGGTTHQYSIDARGAHDPAAVEASVHRALAQHAPSIVKASVSSMKEQQRRTPLSKR